MECGVLVSRRPVSGLINCGRPEVNGILRPFHVGEDANLAHVGGHANGERGQLLLNVLHEGR